MPCIIVILIAVKGYIDTENASSPDVKVSSGLYIIYITHSESPLLPLDNFRYTATSFSCKGKKKRSTYVEKDVHGFYL
jgi:hypothetical protein